MSALVLWIIGIVWFIGIPALIVVENRGVDRFWCLVIWGLMTVPLLVGINQGGV